MDAVPHTHIQTAKQWPMYGCMMLVAFTEIHAAYKQIKQTSQNLNGVSNVPIMEIIMHKRFFVEHVFIFGLKFY